MPDTPPPRSHGGELWARGRKLTDEEAARLEERIEGYPDKTDLRVMLLGYLCEHWKRGPEFRKKANPHLLWIAEHAPWTELNFTGGPPIILLHLETDVPRAMELWLAAVRAHPGDLVVFRNASRVALSDGSYVDELCREARPLDRNRAEWLRLCGDMLEKTVVFGTDGKLLAADAAVDRARRALDCYLDAFALEGDAAELNTIWTMRSCAYAAGERDVVQRLRGADEVAKAATRAAKEGRPVDAQELEARARALVLEVRADRRRA